MPYSTLRCSLLVVRHGHDANNRATSADMLEHMEYDAMDERAEHVQQVFDLMPSRLTREQAEGVEAVIQMDLTGDGGGQWYLDINDRVLTIRSGTYDSPDISMTMAASDWLSIANGDANSVGLFMRGKIQIEGDMHLAMKMHTMFSFSGD